MNQECWQEWKRIWIYCSQCKMSWFEEGGQESTCTCNDQKEMEGELDE